MKCWKQTIGGKSFAGNKAKKQREEREEASVSETGGEAAFLFLSVSTAVTTKQALTVCCRSGIPMRITTVLPVGSSMGAPALWCSATGQKACTPAGEGTPLSSSWELPLSVLAPRLLLAARLCACACVREGECVCCCCWSCRGGLGGSCLPAAGRRGMLRGRGFVSLSLSLSLLSHTQIHTHQWFSFTRLLRRASLAWERKKSRRARERVVEREREREWAKKRGR